MSKKGEGKKNPVRESVGEKVGEGRESKMVGSRKEGGEGGEEWAGTLGGDKEGVRERG
jgi:hypothetical protein